MTQARDAIDWPGGGKRGLKWISAGLSLFMKQPGGFVIAGLLLFAAAAGLNGLGAMGTGIATMMGVVAAGACMRACSAIEQGADPVAAGQSAWQATPLFMLGLLASGLGVAFALLGSAITPMTHALGGAGVFTWLMLLLVPIPLVMGLWLAPGLVAIHGATPVLAIRLSIGAALKNFLPFFTFYLLASIAVCIGGKLHGFGLVFVYPLVLCASYSAFKDIVGPRG